MNNKKEFEELKKSVDYHIKQLRKEIEELKLDRKTLEENIDNIQHNYELINELKRTIEAQKLFNLIVLKKLKKKEKCPTINQPNQ